MTVTVVCVCVCVCVCSILCGLWCVHVCVCVDEKLLFYWWCTREVVSILFTAHAYVCGMHTFTYGMIWNACTYSRIRLCGTNTCFLCTRNHMHSSDTLC
jgi:hypothetical protein